MNFDPLIPDLQDPEPSTMHELYLHFDQPPNFTDEVRKLIEEELRRELEEPNLILASVFPKTGHEVSIYNTKDYWVLKGLQREPGDDAHQIIDLTNMVMSLYTPPLPAKVTGHGYPVSRGDTQVLFENNAPSALGAGLAHERGYRGQCLKLCIIERIWNTRMLGNTIYGKQIDDHRAGVEPCFDNLDPEYDKWIAHSTATLSIMGAQKSIDATSIPAMTPDARIIAVSSLTSVDGRCIEDWAGAIKLAVETKKIWQGHVLLLEGQSIFKRDEDGAEFLVPLEMQEKVFNAIREVVNAGIIVIEPAGNTGVDIHKVTGKFPPIPSDKQLNPKGHSPLDAHDSGAIIVGALDGTQIMDGTNSADRVDLHAWGTMIQTLHPNGISEKHGETSGAAALVAGVAVLAQSAVIANGLPPLNSLEMRHYLKASGSSHVKGIGVMPNLQRFIDEVLPTIPR